MCVCLTRLRGGLWVEKLYEPTLKGVTKAEVGSKHGRVFFYLKFSRAVSTEKFSLVIKGRRRSDSVGYLVQRVAVSLGSSSVNREVRDWTFSRHRRVLMFPRHSGDLSHER